MTATDTVVGVETPPLLGGTASRSWSKQVRKCASNGTKSGLYEKSDGACTSSQKMTILSHRKASAEPDGIFRQKPLEDYVTKEHL
jgi:hypothetical protein